MLVSSNYGIAADASLLAYRAAFGADGDTTGPDCRDNNGIAKSEYPWLLNWAMNDGAQVINVSASSSLQSDELKWAIARSLSQGVIITAAAGNEATDGDTTALSQWSGVVGVSAIGIDGNHCVRATALGALANSLGATVNVRAVASRNEAAFEKTKRRLRTAGVELANG